MGLSGTAELSGWLAGLGHSPSLIRAYWEKSKGCLFGDVLPRALKETVVAVVARETAAENSGTGGAHAVPQTERALTERDPASIPDPESGVPLSHADRIAVDFAARVARDPNAGSDDDFIALRDAGFDDAQINELLSVIDLALMFATTPAR